MSFKVGDKVKYIKNVLLENEDEDDIALIGYEFVIEFIDDGGFHYSKNETHHPSQPPPQGTKPQNSKQMITLKQTC